MATTSSRITFLGFGEAAQAFAKGLRQESGSLVMRAFDIKTNGPQAQAKRCDYAEYDVIGEATSADACRDAGLIFSLVTAEQAEAAAAEAARVNLDGAMFLDCNSCAPGTKRRAASMISAAGGRYIDVAIMTPVHPRLHRSHCLLAGVEAQAALDATRALGMTTEIAGVDVGAASVRKMVRSVMIKGLEALTLECFLAGRKAGIDADVLASLEATFPGFDWQRRVPYMLERALTHGTRRATEMQEVVKALRELGIAPHMAEATCARQQEAGSLGLDAGDLGALGAHDIPAMTDAILTGLASEET